MKKLIYICSVFILAGLMFSCEDDDHTGYSNIVPSNPTISVDVTGESLTEQATEVPFTVTLSEKQTVDVEVYITQTGGDATMGEDFNVPGKIVIPANRLSASGTIAILADDIMEDTETFTLTFGESGTANATISPVSASFTLANATSDMLSIDLSWMTDVIDAIGVDLDPEEVIDYRLLLIDKATGGIVAVADGAAFESLVINENNNIIIGDDTIAVDNGTYIIGADLYGTTLDAGDLNAPLTVDFQLDVFQAGLIDESLEYEDATLNEGACPARRINLATITKSGSTYTIMKDFNIEVTVPDLTGSYGGVDVVSPDAGGPYDADVTITENGGKYFIDGINTAWMFDYWGEEVLSTTPIELTFDGANFTISDQYYMTTLFDGAETDYVLSGSGSVDVCSGEITVSYEMTAPYGNVAEDYIFGPGGMFTAQLSPN